MTDKTRLNVSQYSWGQAVLFSHTEPFFQVTLYEYLQMSPSKVESDPQTQCSLLSVSRSGHSPQRHGVAGRKHFQARCEGTSLSISYAHSFVLYRHKPFKAPQARHFTFTNADEVRLYEREIKAPNLRGMSQSSFIEITGYT
jgi:hypothetical protein